MSNEKLRELCGAVCETMSLIEDIMKENDMNEEYSQMRTYHCDILPDKDTDYVDIDESLIMSIMILGECVRGIDACMVNILDSDCINLVAFMRTYRDSVIHDVNLFLSNKAVMVVNVDNYKSFLSYMKNYYSELSFIDGQPLYEWIPRKDIHEFIFFIYFVGSKKTVGEVAFHSGSSIISAYGNDTVVYWKGDESK